VAKKNNNIQRIMRGLLAGAAVLALAFLVLLGWRWMAALPLERVAFANVQHADTTALLALAQVDTIDTMLEVDPALVADRVQRHPWIASATASRLPTGTLSIDIQERTPVALVMDTQGRPDFFLDRDGFAMPLVAGAVYDVPLLRGFREKYHPVQPVQDAAVRDLLAALADVDNATDALISELDIQPSGEIVLRTTPLAGRGSIPVSLGREDFANRLARLQTFWHRAILTQPEKSFTLIDLRYNGQVVTREEP
jgi:cell division protein FtsQ